MPVEAENFHPKKWFKEDKESHGYNGPIDIEPHDIVGQILRRVNSKPADSMYRLPSQI
jgi:hypothetical protein